jgi:hypothetical protein
MINSSEPGFETDAEAIGRFLERAAAEKDPGVCKRAWRDILNIVNTMEIEEITHDLTNNVVAGVSAIKRYDELGEADEALTSLLKKSEQVEGDTVKIALNELHNSACWDTAAGSLSALETVFDNISNEKRCKLFNTEAAKELANKIDFGTAGCLLFRVMETNPRAADEALFRTVALAYAEGRDDTCENLDLLIRQNPNLGTVKLVEELKRMELKLDNKGRRDSEPRLAHDKILAGCRAVDRSMNKEEPSHPTWGENKVSQGLAYLRNFRR